MHDFSRLKKPYKAVVIASSYLACLIFSAIALAILKYIELADANLAFNLKGFLLAAYVLAAIVSTLMLATPISAFITAVYLQLKEISPFLVSFWSLLSWKFPAFCLEEGGQPKSGKRYYRKIIMFIALEGILSALLVYSYDVIFHKPSLERGAKCQNSNYLTNVNMVFDDITVTSALSLLARFSCNELKYKNVNQSSMELNYIDEPWGDVLRKICDRKNLECITEDGALYVWGKSKSI